jgi:hypothetical protein
MKLGTKEYSYKSLDAKSLSLLEELANNYSISLSDTHTITNQSLDPVEFLHALIKENPLTHDQMRQLWEILPEKERKQYFNNRHVDTQSEIEFQEGVTSLDLYRLAAEENTNHSLALTSEQIRQILSHLTHEQLEQHHQLSYKHAAHTIESTLSAGTQYLSTWYAFLSNYLTVIIELLTTYTVKLSLVLAGGLAFVGSLSLGLTIAWQQAVDNYRKEAGLRMQHIFNCISLNSLKQKNEERITRLEALGKNPRAELSHQRIQKASSHPNIPPVKKLSGWFHFKAWFFSPFRKLIHAIKPQKTGLSATAHGIITGLFIAIALVSTVFLFLTSFYAIAAACAAAGIFSIVIGAVRHDTVQQERMMEAIVKTSEKELQDCKKENVALKKYEAQILEDCAQEHSNQTAKTSVLNISTAAQQLVEQRAQLLKQLDQVENQLRKITSDAATDALLGLRRNQSDAHPHQHEQPAQILDHPNGTAFLNAAPLTYGE